MSATDDLRLRDAVAVVGMACYLPGASNPDEFWSVLAEGRDTVRRLDARALDAAGVSARERAHPDFVPAVAVLDEPDRFDAGFFRLSPREAALMDPQHRKFLECSWEALEHAAFLPDEELSIGVFAGCGMDWYYMRNLNPNRALVEDLGHFVIRHTANDKDFLATRVSYQFDLRGPSVSVQTACSTSLVAIHQATQSLINGECDLAIAGGSTIEVPFGAGYRAREGEVQSPDGCCRPFDHRANGTVFGSGCAAVVLRRLDDALRDRDTIHAVVRGTAINNDGARKVGYLAPSVDGHADVIEEALAIAEVEPREVQLVEAHGTGTRLGDPIEVAAFQQAFRRQADAGPPCALGSVKGNVGHLDAAAGASSFIKAVLALRHGLIPPTVHFESINPEISIDDTRFYVPTELERWDRPGGGRRRAGVSSLGVGGTNAHVVLEEAPDEPAVPAAGERPVVFTWSARSGPALTEMLERHRRFLEAHPETPLDDLAHTLRVGRAAFEHRAWRVAGSVGELAEALGRPGPVLRAAEADGIGFLLSGQGAQFPGMAAGPWRLDATFREVFDRCRELTLAAGGPEIRAAVSADPTAQDVEHMRRTEVAQPALFAVEYAMARSLAARGVHPTALLGHSLGEYVGACLAGVFSLEDAVEIVVARGRLMQSMPAGSMLAVATDEASIRDILPAGLDLAAVNGPDSVVVSGPAAAVDEFARLLEADGFVARPLHTSHAFHSRSMDAAVEPFVALLRGRSLRAPTLPLVSNVTGTWLTAEEATSPEYWGDHLRNAVRFHDGLATLRGADLACTLEVGPGDTLTKLAAAGGEAAIPGFPTMSGPRGGDEGRTTALAALGGVWASGGRIDLGRANPVHGRRIPLPTYPFQRTRHWIDAPGNTPAEPEDELRRRPPHQWFHAASWKPAARRADPDRLREAAVWVLRRDDQAVQPLAARLSSSGARVIDVPLGSLDVEPDRAVPSRAAIDALLDDQGVPDLVLLATALDASEGRDLRRRPVDGDFGAAVVLIQALVAAGGEVDVVVCTRGLMPVPGSAVTAPERATLLGLCRVVPVEHPEISVRLVDLGPADPVEGLAGELTALEPEPVVAYRSGRRYVQELTPLDLPEPEGGAGAGAVDGRVCLVLGAFGGVGQRLTEWLAAGGAEGLVLVGRTSPEEPGRGARRSGFLRRVRETGIPTEVHVADVCAPDAMARVVADTVERFGRIDDVYHLAGRLDDGLLALRPLQAMDEVMAPKVQGTMALDHALRDASQAPRVVLFSSVSAHVGVAGQVDYAAANAFLDVWAHRPRAVDEPSYRVVNWGMWADVGMAAALDRTLALGDALPERTEPFDHPVLQRYGRTSAGAHVFVGDLSARDYGFLSDHRLRDGPAILPGTACVDLVLAAAGRVDGGTAEHEIRDLTLLTPLALEDEAVRTVVVTLEPDHEGFAVTIQSSGGRGDVIPHAEGTVRAVRASAPDPPAPVTVPEPRAWDGAGHPLLDFGRRWSRLETEIHRVGDAASVLVRDPEQASGAGGDTFWQPALLDVALGGAFSDDDESRSAVPFSYERVVAVRPIGGSLRSTVTRRRLDDGRVVLDAYLHDDDGWVGGIEGFTMRVAAGPGTAAPGREGRARRTGSVTDLGMDLALSPAEGLEALGRILAAPEVTRVVVSTVSPSALEQALHTESSAGATGAEGGTEELAPRPPVSADYVAPSTDLERTVADAWAHHLGVREVGLDDDFFELGGHSLLLTRILQDLRKNRRVALPMGDAFDRPTVRRWVAAAGEAPDEPRIGRIDRRRFRRKAGDVGEVV